MGNWAVRARLDPTASVPACDQPANEPQQESAVEAQDPWLAISLQELNRSFRDFSKKAGRLTRLAQRKKKDPVPSEAFNHLLSVRVAELDRAFGKYLRRKNDLLTYLRATTYRAERKSEGAANQLVRPRKSRVSVSAS